MTITKKNTQSDAEELFPCPVCGNLVEEWEICDVCNWENTGPVNVDGGPNKMKLIEAQKAYNAKKLEDA